VAKTDQFERPEGFQEHHRRKGDRQRDVRGAETILVDAETHKWIEEHPEEARRLGWSVSRSEDPLDVPIVIPSPPKERKQRGPRPKQKPRDRVNVAMRVPQDKQEDGAGMWDDLMALGRDFLCERMGWQDDVPDYNVAMVLVAQGLEVVRATPEEED